MELQETKARETPLASLRLGQFYQEDIWPFNLNTHLRI